MTKKINLVHGSHRRLIGLEETAGILGYSIKTMRRLAAQRKIPVIKLGRSVRVDVDELQAFIDQHKIEPKNPL